MIVSHILFTIFALLLKIDIYQLSAIYADLFTLMKIHTMIIIDILTYTISIYLINC